MENYKRQKTGNILGHYSKVGIERFRCEPRNFHWRG
jgi:hypothetical protein